MLFISCESSSGSDSGDNSSIEDINNNESPNDNTVFQDLPYPTSIPGLDVNTGDDATASMVTIFEAQKTHFPDVINHILRVQQAIHANPILAAIDF